MACYFGKKLIITDHKDWSTDLIIQSYREQDGIEKIFHDTKDTLMNELSGIRGSWVKENRDDTIGGQVIRKLEEMNECQKKIWEIIAMI